MFSRASCSLSAPSGPATVRPCIRQARRAAAERHHRLTGLLALSLSLVVRLSARCLPRGWRVFTGCSCRGILEPGICDWPGEPARARQSCAAAPPHARACRSTCSHFSKWVIVRQRTADQPLSRLPCGRCVVQLVKMAWVTVGLCRRLKMYVLPVALLPWLSLFPQTCGPGVSGEWVPG